MGPGYRQLLVLSSRAVDQLILIVSFDLAAGAMLLGSGFYSLPLLFEVRFKASNLLLFVLLMVAWHAICAAFGLYRSRRLATFRAELLEVVEATTVGSLVALAVAWRIVAEFHALRFFVSFWLLSSALTALARLTMGYVLQRFRLRGRNLRNLLIVGTNARALRFVELLERKRTLGYQIKGFVDEDWRGIDAFHRTGRPLVARLGDFGRYLREHVVDEVVIALPVSSHYGQFHQILSACEEQGVLVHMLPDFFDVKHARLRLEVVEDQPVISLRTGAMEGWPVLVKQALDITLAFVLLVSLAPLLAVVAVLIKLTSPGPVLFVQDRVGLHKRPFRFLKFRTMVHGAEQQQQALAALNEASGPVFKIRKDPRITSIGWLLRRTSIDELLQLINVLFGDMSLVGPRPLPLRDYEAFDADWHRRRFSVRPGMTCLWQVGGRSSIPFDRWMQLDMQYIDEWSLWLDLKILASTVPAVLTGRGAS
jgi:exopolysaccharide biosynthesis polyprenyl glycosylphosphotransferase